MSELSEAASLRRRQSQNNQEQSFIKLDHLKGKAWYERINWLNCSLVFGLPISVLYYLCTASTEEHYWQTWLLALVYYLWTGMSITAGYHRLYAHRSYCAHPSLEALYLLGGAGALQGSAKWWGLLHRAHHRWTDTDKDPYNAKRGFWYAHVGWLLLDSVKITDHIDIHDLKCSKMVRWQHQHYAWLGPFMSVVLPTLIAWLGWGDVRGGFYVAGCMRTLFIHHATWCINSVAHWYGETTFDDEMSPKDSIVAGLLTFGEGYHNFHHEFPNDYRNGIHWYDYDPTKWVIDLCSSVGLASALVTFPGNEIRRGEVDMKQKKLDLQKATIKYGKPLDSLPKWDQSEFETQSQSGRVLLAIANVIHDVTEFVKSGGHPGGKKLLVERNGTDVTSDFNGTFYNHTNAARHLMSHMRVARLD